MNYTEYFLYRELAARIKALPGELSPAENEILAATIHALRVFPKNYSLEQTVRKILKLKDLGELNVVG